MTGFWCAGRRTRRIRRIGEVRPIAGGRDAVIQAGRAVSRRTWTGSSRIGGLNRFWLDPVGFGFTLCLGF
jgi:hypothetical protein